MEKNTLKKNTNNIGINSNNISIVKPNFMSNLSDLEKYGWLMIILGIILIILGVLFW